ncbi:hypothetical protein [Streptomyces sp. NPDC057238]|uniref:hypothetical protein n=1 Tax=Streptomyces sp. NPDC057238 TaxID=3346060 RepID=UPI003630F99D
MSRPLTTRVTPAVHEALVSLAARRRKSLAATAADLLSAAVADPDGTPRPPDGEMTAAVLQALGHVTAPQAVLLREVALSMARIVERGDHGAAAAAQRLMEAASKALQVQARAEVSTAGPVDALLASLVHAV